MPSARRAGPYTHPRHPVSLIRCSRPRSEPSLMGPTPSMPATSDLAWPRATDPGATVAVPSWTAGRTPACPPCSRPSSAGRRPRGGRLRHPDPRAPLRRPRPPGGRFCRPCPRRSPVSTRGSRTWPTPLSSRPVPVPSTAIGPTTPSTARWSRSRRRGSAGWRTTKCCRWGARGCALWRCPGYAPHHLAIYDEMAQAVFSGDIFGISYRVFDNPAAAAFIFPTTCRRSSIPSSGTPRSSGSAAWRLRWSISPGFQPRDRDRGGWPRAPASGPRPLRRHRRGAGRGPRCRGADSTAPRSTTSSSRLAAHGTRIDAETRDTWLEMDVRLNAAGLLAWQRRLARACERMPESAGVPSPGVRPEARAREAG